MFRRSTWLAPGLVATWLVVLAAAAQTDAPSPGVAANPQVEAPAESGDARIIGLRLTLKDQQAWLSFRLRNAFDEDMRQRVMSGLPTRLTFEFELVRARRGWFNTGVDSGSLQVIAMYNAVTREYLINYKHDGDLIESRIVQDFDELRAAMTDFKDFPAFSTLGRNTDQRLRIRVRAELRPRTIFFFIPATVYTDWAESRKFRLSEELD